VLRTILAISGRLSSGGSTIAQRWHALEFFRKAGATAWIREAEKLLAATA
jgi:hypothetical protein